MDTPIFDFVQNYIKSNTARLHMPGHKGVSFLGCEAFDITEIQGADELYAPDGIIRKSEENATLLFGTAKTVYSAGGSSQSINAMLYLAYLGVLWGLVLVGNILCGSIQDKMIETFNNCSYAIIAALIATRGWLMSEEQVMKKISNRYTFIICILIAIIMTISFVPHTRPDNTNEPIETILDNKDNEHSISPDSVVYNIHNDKNSNTNDTLNNTRNIKLKAYDLPQMKTPDEHKSSIPTKKKAEICDKINSSQDTISK
jgi:hypothetical protein